MRGGDVFFDTNVLLYLISEDITKADRAETLLALGGVISVQVLNEFAGRRFAQAGSQLYGASPNLGDHTRGLRCQTCGH